MDPYISAKTVRRLYIAPYAFPAWVLDPSTWPTHRFKETCVYYHSTDSQTDVETIMAEREPCNIGMERNYDQEGLFRAFGYREGGYSRISRPNVAVYCHASIKLPEGMKHAHVINLIGLAFDTPEQPDFQHYSKKPLHDIVAAYARMWKLALAAAVDHPAIKTIQIYNVGGGAFAGPYYPQFNQTIFEPAFAHVHAGFEKRGITITGYDWTTHRFTGGFIPDCLSTADLDTTLFVNAWDPWSLIGNGNERDQSLDGYWGRISNMAVLGWKHTNPHLQYVAVR
jgi:hypothetical protein